MLRQKLFHPYHVVPFSEFIAAFFKFAHKAVAHVSVKFRAVVCKVFVLIAAVRRAYTGFKRVNVLHAGNVFDCRIELFADTFFKQPGFKVNGSFRTVYVCGTSHKGACVGIPQLFPPLLRKNIWVSFQGVFYPLPECLGRRHLGFKRNGGFFHIGGIDFQKLLRVIRRGCSQCDIVHVFLSLRRYRSKFSGSSKSDFSILRSASSSLPQFIILSIISALRLFI